MLEQSKIDLLPPVNVREALRYAGVRGEGKGERTLLLQCAEELLPQIQPRFCYVRLDKEELFEMISFARESKGLAGAIGASKEVILFGGTLGVGVDRLILRYEKISPSKALMMQALGAERIERLCELFCEEWKEKGFAVGGRFSPGYGDFPLEAQRDIFRVLDCSKRIGLTLTEGLLMSPTKSVTAIFGIKNEI